MAVTDNDILNKHPDFFPEKFYTDVIGDELTSQYSNFGIELGIKSATIEAWRQNMQTGVWGNTEKIVYKIVFTYLEKPEATVRELHKAIAKLNGRLAQDMLVKARIHIDDKALESDVTVEDGTDGVTKTLPDVPRERQARDVEEESQATPQLGEPLVAVVNPMATNHHSNREASMEVAMDTDGTVAGEASRPELFRLSSDQDPDESLEGLR